jgi:hypothetical protein
MKHLLNLHYIAGLYAPVSGVHLWYNQPSKSHSLDEKKKGGGQSSPCNRLCRPIGLWDVKAPTFSRKSAHRWRWGCQPHQPAGNYQLGRFLVLIFDRGWVDPFATVWREGLDQLKNLLTPSGIESATFQLVAQCPKQLRYCVLLCLSNKALGHEGVWGSGYIDQRVLDLGSSCMRVVRLTPRPLYSGGKVPRHPLDRRLRGPQKRSGRRREQKYLDLTGTQTPTPGPSIQ